LKSHFPGRKPVKYFLPLHLPFIPAFSFPRHGLTCSSRHGQPFFTGRLAHVDQKPAWCTHVCTFALPVYSQPRRHEYRGCTFSFLPVCESVDLSRFAYSRFFCKFIKPLYVLSSSHGMRLFYLLAFPASYNSSTLTSMGCWLLFLDRLSQLFEVFYRKLNAISFSPLPILLLPPSLPHDNPFLLPSICSSGTNYSRVLEQSAHSKPNPISRCPYPTYSSRLC